MADGGGTLASALPFIGIHPGAAGIFRLGTKWRAVGQTNAAVCKTSRRFKASKPPEEADNGGVISAFRAKLETFASVSQTLRTTFSSFFFPPFAIFCLVSSGEDQQLDWEPVPGILHPPVWHWAPINSIISDGHNGWKERVFLQVPAQIPGFLGRPVGFGLVFLLSSREARSGTKRIYNCCRITRAKGRVQPGRSEHECVD